MKRARRLAAGTVVGAVAALFAGQAAGQGCGGDFRAFLQGVKQEALSKGLSERAIDATLSGASVDRKVLSLDRRQGVFKQTFLEFSKRSVNGYRLKHGAANMQKYASVFARAERDYGVPAPVITAFWGLETDYGAVQGDFNTVNALATLAHDCRRPELFRPQLLAAIEMVQHGDLDPRRTTGAWAGEIGQVQMLPEDIVRYGIDGDGDGHVTLKTSAPDAIMTAAHFIQSLGWRRGEPWLQEVKTPSSLPWQEAGLHTSKTVADWARLGVQPRSGPLPSGNLRASLLLPQGRNGPAFLAYPNFNIYLQWNQSFIYTTSAAYFATRLAGAPPYDAGNPDPGLSDAQMMALQQKLQAKGYDVGGIDGILGSGTRAAVRAEQARLGLPADGWPTAGLLAKL
ncbi:lytic murein transglycosylase [Rhizobiales bacterium]|uniref:lytic murein transglycosylase n=1 Tax=Hongsoonwoonella zoysiae TaxID=2821844 RepID=UPI00156147F3|nr:lytic murein transglycosylase [Hongsoonwoonella zoysiae]NRG16587.1 lytic murein transglycosylase [Hongsoonwoonella zoysiae]